MTAEPQARSAQRSPLARRSGAAPGSTGIWIYRAANIVLAACIAVAIILEIALLATNQVDTQFHTPTAFTPFSTRLVEMFSFLTTLSNLLAGVVAVLLAVDPDRTGRLWRVVRLVALTSIAAIGLVFQILFAPHLQLTGLPLLMTVLYHYIDPLLAVLTWLLLDARRQWRFVDVLWSLIWPVLYLVYTFIRGAAAHWYPYAVIDVDRLGAAAAIRNGVGVVVVFFVLGTLAYVVDRRVPSFRTSRRSARS